LIEVRTISPEQTRGLGAALARALRPGDVVALAGELGAGKTVLVQGMARGLGVSPRTLVTSPSFVLLHEYQGNMPLYHFDFYRLSKEDEVLALGYEEYQSGCGICAIEWADRFPGLFGQKAVWVAIRSGEGDVREFSISTNKKREAAIRSSLEAAGI